MRRSFGNHSPLILKQLLAKDVSDEEFNVFVGKFEQAFAQHYQSAPTALLPGALETLNHLKSCGYILCVASNAPRAVLNKGLTETETLRLFDHTVCADEYPPKPHPLMLEKTLIQVECIPSKAIMVGDHFNDIIAAVEANITPIGVLSGSQDHDGLAPHRPITILNNVNALPSWLYQHAH